MYDCECLIHPFQNDPGTSQNGRIMEALLSGAAKIDARTLADLLDYFVQLSRHINYYDAKLNVSDWQQFFKNSIPFTLSSAIKYQPDQLQNELTYYNFLFEKKPSSTGLQLQAYFIFYHFINKINNWYLAVKDSGLPIEKNLEIIIKDKLQQPVKDFIKGNNAAVKWYGIKRIDFLPFYDNKIWNLDLIDLYAIDESFRKNTNSKFKHINNLYQQFSISLPVFFTAIKNISEDAEKNLEISLFPLKEELQKSHPPHLGLLFAFLNMFRYLQDDLNGFTRKHLDFFYKDILQIKSREAVADKAHILFEIQKQLSNYLIKKGILLKDGKDIHKEQILFSLDDEIVVTKTQVADVRTLFLNNQTIPDPGGSGTNIALLEGLYMAPDATKADGIEKDFQTEINNFYTLGNKESKYILPEANIYKPYPNVRLAFILASPVLLLNEGSRTVTITLNCTLDQNICEELSAILNPASKNCCNENNATPQNGDVIHYPDFFPLNFIYADIVEALKTEYYYVSEDLIAAAIQKGLDFKTIAELRSFLISSNEHVEPRTYCYCPTETKIFDAVINKNDFENKIDIQSEIVSSFFKKRKPVRLFFSGEKEWIEPGDDALTSFDIVPGFFSNQFSFIINTTISPDRPSVTFYDKEKLKEDIDTALPLVKVELDDHFKIFYPYETRQSGCCLNKKLEFNNNKIPVSLYHFFRNVRLEKESKIDVQVCGLKNFIVQNDESLQDVNGPVYPFGVRPVIRNFDIYTLPIVHNTSNTGPSFYIGSKEIFCKNWVNVRINLNWKDKPDDFREYYKGYVVEDPAATPQVFGLDEDKFLIKISYLQNGTWKDEMGFRKLFDTVPPGPLPTLPAIPLQCDHDAIYSQGIILSSTAFSSAKHFAITEEEFKKLDVNTRNGFIKINLRDQDFLHKDYAFVLSRQMMALGRYPDALLEGAVYKKEGDTVIVFRSTGKRIVELKEDIEKTKEKTQLSKDKADDLNTTFDTAIDWPPPLSTINNGERDSLIPLVHQNKNLADDSFQKASETRDKLEEFQSLWDIFNDQGEIVKPLTVLIPNEPWTPVIANMSLDYTATATSEDIDLIHLYPFKETYKHEEIKANPTLFPTFCDEGTLFLGLKDLLPGDNLNVLFQLAEATSDSESAKEEVHWYYLDNNVWKPLRKGFEVLNDAAENLTASGIVKFALPQNMTKDNTVMPKNLHWIKACIPKNSKAVGEATGIYSQAAEVTFTNNAANDKLRLQNALAANSISKLNDADANIKSVVQPYETFGGRLPEMEGQFYVRVSEQLRHKGRAIQKFDYERLALEAFPQVFKAKCINHSFALDAHIYKSDFPYAPGYVILAVIPDLNKLKAGNSFEPKVPVSIIEKIDAYIRKRTSPFVRFRTMNPRYEEINICVRVKLMPGKDQNYYREKLKQDLRELLAPWAVGKYDKLSFGQCVYRSDVVFFLETRDYIDFISDFKMGKETEVPSDKSKICPDTPRSIFIAGNIDVCIEPPECEKWMVCGDQNNNEIKDCCASELVPVAQYCKDE